METSTSAGGCDLPEVNVEAVGEHQRLARGQVRRDLALVQIALDMIGHQNHHGVGGLGGVRRTISTFSPAASALAPLLLPACRPTITLTPLSRRFSAWA